MNADFTKYFPIDKKIMFFHAIMQCQLTWNISIEPLSLYIKTRTGSFSMSIFFNVDAATLPKCLVIIFTARVLLEEKVKSHPKVTKFSFKKLHTESEHRAWVQKTLVRTELSWCKYTANIFLWKERTDYLLENRENWFHVKFPHCDLKLFHLITINMN